MALRSVTVSLVLSHFKLHNGGAAAHENGRPVCRHTGEWRGQTPEVAHIPYPVGFLYLFYPLNCISFYFGLSNFMRLGLQKGKQKHAPMRRALKNNFQSYSYII